MPEEVVGGVGICHGHFRWFQSRGAVLGVESRGMMAQSSTGLEEGAWLARLARGDLKYRFVIDPKTLG